MAQRRATATPSKAVRPTQDLTATEPATSELEKWLAEGKRLFAEAEARVVVGDFLPALSSLAALPPLHGTLCERLSELVHAGPQAPDEPDHCGMYL